MLFESDQYFTGDIGLNFILDNNSNDNNNFNYNHTNNNYNNNNYNKNYSKANLFSADEGFLRGNMFRNLYDEYRYSPFRPNLTNQKDKLMFDLAKYNFAIIDLGLYLDLYPNDMEVYSIFKNYINEYEKSKQEYERLYGPLCLTNTTGNNFNWINNPWPWDKEGANV